MRLLDGALGTLKIDLETRALSDWAERNGTSYLVTRHLPGMQETLDLIPSWMQFFFQTFINSQVGR